MKTAPAYTLSRGFKKSKKRASYKDVDKRYIINQEILDFIDSLKYLNINIKFIENDQDLINIGEQEYFLACLQKVNDIKWVNNFFSLVNAHLINGGVFFGCVEIFSQRMIRIRNKYPKIFSEPFIILSFIFNRILPRINPTKFFHKYLTKGNNRVMSKAEIFGRLVYCGYDIVKYKSINNLTYFACTKVQEPCSDKHPTFGVIAKIKRIGKEGKLINFYKFRTMHPYSEYLQDYTYKCNSIDQGGKFKNDFRIARWGKVLRKLWIDEFPMLINLLKGDLKLVGVRPLSRHYFNLYPSQYRERRIKYKPGLIPPYYADLPKGIDEIIESEQKYLDSFDKNPIKTDIRYFFLVVYSILFKRIRSK